MMAAHRTGRVEKTRDGKEKRGWQSAGKLVGFLLVVVSAMHGLWTGKLGTMVAGAVAGLLLMAFVDLDQFSFLKGLGFEARMRKTEEAAREAVATLEDLRAVALALGRLELEMLSRAGLIGAFPETVKFELRDDLVSELRKIGASDDAIADATVVLREITHFRHCAKVVDAAAKAAGKDVPEQRKADERIGEVARSLRDELLDWDSRKSPSAAQMRQAVADFAADDAVVEALLDLDHFEATGELRRPEIWP